MDPGAPASWPLLDGLSRPAVVTDEQGAVVFVNARAEAFWGFTLAEVAGRAVGEVLHVRLPGEASLEEWVRAVVRPALATGAPVPVTVTGRDGRPHQVDVTGMWETRDDGRYAVLTFSEQGARAEPRVAPPGLRDPATGLLNFHPRTPEYRYWDARSGALVLFDLDALREVNALYGLHAGDTILAVAGRAVAAEAPPHALAARCGDDELVLILGGVDAGSANEVASRVRVRMEQAASAAGVLAAPRLHSGAAAFGPGSLEGALQEAKDALYQQRGVLLRARGGGRVVLTREGAAALQQPGGERTATAPGAFSSKFTTEFDRHFRQAYARSVEQAREFVAFVDPEPGSAVVEVGAGSGRITLDGGLAARVGREGQLLVTDPSPAQLQVARNRAEELGFDWVRFVCAPVEALPVAPGTADLCLGSTFLHFTEPSEAIRAMARVVRVGGRVAVSAGADIEWPPAWREILAPVYRALELHGQSLALFTPRPALEEAFQAAGLVVDRAVQSTERVDYGSAEGAVAVWRQTRLVPLMLRRLPREATRAVEEAFEARLRDVWEAQAAEDLMLNISVVHLMGHREG